MAQVRVKSREIKVCDGEKRERAETALRASRNTVDVSISAAVGVTWKPNELESFRCKQECLISWIT